MNNYFWESEHIRFRRFKESDWEKLYETQNDSHEVRCFEGGLEPLKTEATYKQYILDNLESAYKYAIEDIDSNYVGTASISGINPSAGTFYITVQVFKEYRKRGYAKEAIKMMLNYAFNELRLNKANSETIDINYGSIKLHESVGFTIEGTRRQNVFTEGKYHDEILFGMTRDEYRKLYLL
ncbi:MAG: GNAT family N-acetyltransferase [Clostridiales bacterium]|nr:GNAT family N-acetyltransferase [Clostridiales bacterium]